MINIAILNKEINKINTATKQQNVCNKDDYKRRWLGFFLINQI